MTYSDSPSSNEILKIDRRGRVRSTAAQRAAVLAQFDRSGLSGTKFAAVAGINYQTFAGWLAKRRRSGQQSEAPAQGTGVTNGAGKGSMRWVEAIASHGAACPEALRVELRGGTRLEIRSASQVPLAVALLKALETGEGWPC